MMEELNRTLARTDFHKLLILVIIYMFAQRLYENKSFTKEFFIKFINGNTGRILVDFGIIFLSVLVSIIFVFALINLLYHIELFILF